MDNKSIILACRWLLRPIASLLLKCGLTWREFSAISKLVFVDVASSEYGIKGRPTNISRISILTGINRREVRRQRQLLAGVTSDASDADDALPNKTTDATRLLSGWHQDKEFLGNDGQPRALPLEDGEVSFKGLCRRYGGDVPVSAMLKELKRVGAVEQGADGNLRALLRYYMPVTLDAEWILNAGSVLADLGRNLNHNLQAGDDNPSQFMGRAVNRSVLVEALPEFREFLEQQGQEFLEEIDTWLTERSTDDENANTMRLGVGLFHIEDTTDVRG